MTVTAFPRSSTLWFCSSRWMFTTPLLAEAWTESTMSISMMKTTTTMMSLHALKIGKNTAYATRSHFPSLLLQYNAKAQFALPQTWSWKEVKRESGNFTSFISVLDNYKKGRFFFLILFLHSSVIQGTKSLLYKKIRYKNYSVILHTKKHPLTRRHLFE